MIGLQDESMKSMNRIISTPSDGRYIRWNRISRIDTLGVNKDIWSVIDTTSNVLSDADNVKKFDTHVQLSTTQERNLESLRIEEESLKSIFPELGLKFGLSLRTEFARFTRTLESNFDPSSGKILFKLSSSMRDNFKLSSSELYDPRK